MRGTGLDWLPEESVLTFHSLDAAVATLARLESDYDRHAHAERSLAQAVFASAGVLTDLLEAV